MSSDTQTKEENPPQRKPLKPTRVKITEKYIPKKDNEN